MVELLVKNLYNRRLADSLVIDALEPLDKVIRTLYKKPNLRDVFLVTPENRLYGTVTRHDLLVFLTKQLGSTAGQSIVEVAATLKKAKVKDVVHKFSYVTSVTPDTNISEALKAMVMLDVVDIPVIDKNRRIIGEITLPAILNRILQAPRKKHNIQDFSR